MKFCSKSDFAKWVLARDVLAPTKPGLGICTCGNTAPGFAWERFRTQHVANDENGGEARKGHTENHSVRKTGIIQAGSRRGRWNGVSKKSFAGELEREKNHNRKTAFKQSVGQTPPPGLWWEKYGWRNTDSGVARIVQRGAEGSSIN